MNPYNKLFEERIILLSVRIDDASANDVIAQLIVLKSIDPDRDITMYINSPGGSVTSMMAIYDTMLSPRRFVQPEIQAVCIGPGRREVDAQVSTNPDSCVRGACQTAWWCSSSGGGCAWSPTTGRRLLDFRISTRAVLTLDLQLGEEWMLGERIGGGGFGQVYAAKSSSGRNGVVKLVPKAPGAQRELLFADLTDVRNVVPIIDQGETVDHWVLAMPRADRSLRDYLKASEGPLSVEGAVAVLSDIATALTDLDGRVVHRDLKPENVLLLDGHWCLADFGISRYAEATTAPDTRQHAMSPPYAAPERWRQERATSATDEPDPL